MINFAVGEWTMVGSRMAARGRATRSASGSAERSSPPAWRVIGLALFFNRVVLRPLFHRSLLSLIMVTIGVGIFMRGAATVVFAGSRCGSVSPFPVRPAGRRRSYRWPVDKIAAAAIAAAAIAALELVLQRQPHGPRAARGGERSAGRHGGRDRLSIATSRSRGAW